MPYDEDQEDEDEYSVPDWFYLRLACAKEAYQWWRDCEFVSRTASDFVHFFEIVSKPW